MKTGNCVHKAIFVFLLSILILGGSYGVFFDVRLCLAGHNFTKEEERKLGKKFKHELERRLQFIKDPSVKEYIDSVSKNIVSQLEYQPFDFNFYVYLASDPNAFATPGGYIYISSGLITLAENESELAGVLCHEMAHVTARHIAEKIEKESKLSIGALAAVLAGIFLGGTEAAEAIGVFSIATAQTLSLKYSRENEEEADRLGLGYLIKAGYDGLGMISFLKKLKRYHLPTVQPPPYLLTHPGIENRINYLDTMLKRLPKPEEPQNEVEGFRRMQARVIVRSWTSQKAANYFKSALESNPRRLDLICGLALANQKLENYSEAVQGFKVALTIHPEDGEILRDLGICYFSQGRPRDAIPSLEKSVAINEKDTSALYYLARAHQESGNFQEAIELYLRVKRLKADYVDVYYNLGIAYGKKGLLGEAHRNFGCFFKLKGKLDSALFHFKKALKYLKEGSKERREVLREINGIEKIKRKDR